MNQPLKHIRETGTLAELLDPVQFFTLKLGDHRVFVVPDSWRVTFSPPCPPVEEWSTETKETLANLNFDTLPPLRTDRNEASPADKLRALQDFLAAEAVRHPPQTASCNSGTSR